jgi:hypothetical protein
MKFYRNAAIEERAEQRIAELEAILGKPVEPPIPLELIAEQLLGLDILWEEIDELPGELIYGGLRIEERLIVMNEKRRALFEEKPGLERSTKGHEMGHWDLFGRSDQPGQLLLFEDDARFVRRSSPAGELRVMAALIKTPEGQELLRQIQKRADEPDEARAVNRYAAALSMPKRLITEEALKIDRRSWPPLYRLAERFEVSITALKVRLQQLNLLYVDDSGGLYESREQATGQKTLF